jgi:putative modified peptide
MDMKKVGPNGLDPAVAKRLLDLLSTDDAFRALFEADAKSALLQVGHIPASSNTVESWACLQLPPGTRLASKDSIATGRAKLEAALHSIHGFLAPLEMQQK